MCEVGRFEREDMRGASVEDARGGRRFDGLGEEVDELPVSSTWEASLLGVSFRGRVSVPRVPLRVASAACSRLSVAQKEWYS